MIETVLIEGTGTHGCYIMLISSLFFSLTITLQFVERHTVRTIFTMTVDMKTPDPLTDRIALDIPMPIQHTTKFLEGHLL